MIEAHYKYKNSNNFFMQLELSQYSKHDILQVTHTAMLSTCLSA